MNSNDKIPAIVDIREALAESPGATSAGLAETLKMGRSTVTAALAKLEKDAVATRAPGGRDGAVRRPDTWTVVVVAPAEPEPHAATTNPSGEALRPGALRAMVAAFLAAQEAPVTPHQVGKALDRSVGAVANALSRMTLDGQAVQTSLSPRAYRQS